MGAKLDSLFAQPAQAFQAEDLKPATVGQNRTIPGHETVQSAGLLNPLKPRPQIQMVGVGQDDFGPDFAQFARGHGLDCCLGRHRHEGGGLHPTVSRHHTAQACLGVGIGVGHTETKHVALVLPGRCMRFWAGVQLTRLGTPMVPCRGALLWLPATSRRRSRGQAPYTISMPSP